MVGEKLKFVFGGEEHEVDIADRDASIAEFGKVVVGCFRCGLLWTEALVRRELMRQIEELTERDPISKNMLHRGEWKELKVEGLFELRTILEDAVLLREKMEREDGLESTRTAESERRNQTAICKESRP